MNQKYTLKSLKSVLLICGLIGAAGCGSEDDFINGQALGDCEGCVLLDDDPNIELEIAPDIDPEGEGEYEYLAPAGFTGDININTLNYQDEEEIEYGLRGGAIHAGADGVGAAGCDGEGNSLVVYGVMGVFGLAVSRRRRR